MNTLNEFILELNRVYYENSASWNKEEMNTFRGHILEQIVTRILKSLGYKIPKHKTRSTLIDIRAYKGKMRNNELLFVGECVNFRYSINLSKSNIKSLNEHFTRYHEIPKYIFISFGHLLEEHGMEMLRTHNPTIIEFDFQLLPEGEYTGHILSRPLTVKTYNEMEDTISKVIPRCPL